MRNRLALSAFLVICFCVVVWWIKKPASDLSALQIRQLMIADTEAAFAAVHIQLEAAPDSPEILQLAADVAETAGKESLALQHLLHLVSLPHGLSDRAEFDVQKRISRLSLSTGDLVAPETAFKRCLQLQPNDNAVIRELATLLLSECRRFESQTYLLSLVQQRSFLLDELVMLGSVNELLEDRELLAKAKTDETNILITSTALARLDAFDGNYQAAIHRLTAVLPDSEELSDEFWATLLLSFVGTADVADLGTHLAMIRTETIAHPDVAYAGGWFHYQRGEMDLAVQHLCRSIRLSFNHRPALQLLGNILSEKGHADLALELLNRSQLLDETESLLHRILMNDRDVKHMQRIAAWMEQLGRRTEAWAWHMAIAGYHKSAAAEALANAERILGSIPRSMPLIDVETETKILALLQRAEALNLSSPKQTGVLSAAERSPSQQKNATEFQFQDVAQDVGLSVPYFFGKSDDPRALRLFEGFGGGVGVVDIDHDGLPDLFFSQSNTFPLSDDARSSDLLYRNRGRSFEQVSAEAIPSDRAFGQGVAVGDFNEDGFEDIYVANIGPNHLLINNGDGSFSRESSDLIDDNNDWTTSCAMADLNDDGVTDLFDVTYSQDSELFTRLCPSGAEQHPRSCRPGLFAGSTDHLLLGDGAGRLSKMADPDFLPRDDGRGLGVLIANMLGDRRLEIFVSNDMTANALLVPSAVDEGPVAYNDEAILRGVSVNGTGRIEACMGIASADVNDDGLIDLFVTNFLEETNTLYSLGPGRVFRDLSAVSGAAGNSLEMLSFGAQFVDADNNGTQDLFLVNGHVDDFTHNNAGWKMLPAAYSNIGSGQFQHLPQQALGIYGQRPSLGRAMARLDWNGDGRVDLVITHLDRHPALLQNNTPSAGTALTLRLSGTASTRRPVGAVVTLTVRAGQTIRNYVNFVTAGDGYYCSNQSELTFSILPGDIIERIDVQWPSGGQQSFHSSIQPGSWLAVEGNSRLFELAK